VFPSELELEYRRQEMHREAEHHRLVQSLRTTPSLWQRLRARLNVRPVYVAQSQRRHDVIALSR
jgi:hypothetical protein